MKILQIGKYYPPAVGGIESVVYEITEGLNEQHVECDVLCANTSPTYQHDRINNYNVYRAKSYGTFSSTSFSPQLIIKLNEIKNIYDVISIHLPNPLANLAIFLCRPKGKIVLHWHSDILKQKYSLKIYEPLLTWLLKRSNLIIGATESHINESNYTNLFINKSKVVPYPLNLKKFSNNNVNKDLYHRLKRKHAGERVILSTGRLIYYKGFEYLIDAAEHLEGKFKILIIGDGELRRELNDRIIRKKLGNKVELLGRIADDELPTYYSFCDLFCLPSIFRTEMFGVVQLEAMAMGKPVVSTKIARSGVSHVNMDRETGLIVAPMDSKALANAFVEILDNEDIYKKMSLSAVSLIEKKYRREIVIQSLIKSYNDVMLKH